MYCNEDAVNQLGCGHSKQIKTLQLLYTVMQHIETTMESMEYINIMLSLAHSGINPMKYINIMLSLSHSGINPMECINIMLPLSRSMESFP